MTDKTTDRQKNIKDSDIESWLKRKLPDAPPQPMFTRMVMNRLPERAVRIASIVEYTLYIIGIAATTVTAIRYISAITSTGEATPTDLTVVGVMIALGSAMLYSLIAQWTSPQR